MCVPRHTAAAADFARTAVNIAQLRLALSQCRSVFFFAPVGFLLHTLHPRAGLVHDCPDVAVTLSLLLLGVVVRVSPASGTRCVVCAANFGSERLPTRVAVDSIAHVCHRSSCHLRMYVDSHLGPLFLRYSQAGLLLVRVCGGNCPLGSACSLQIRGVFSSRRLVLFLFFSLAGRLLIDPGGKSTMLCSEQ